MKIETSNTRYRWRDLLGGRFGEIPWIDLWDQKIPPLGKVNSVQVRSRSENKLANSSLFLTWIEEESHAILQVVCNANDERLMTEYEASPAVKELIIGVLSQPKLEKEPADYRTFRLSNYVQKSEIPEAFHGDVDNIKLWSSFFKQPHVSGLQGRHFTTVNGEGFYLAPVTSNCLRLGKEHDPQFGVTCEGFDFDPQTQAPVIEEDGVYWKLPESKVTIILPHSVASDKVAEYYSYFGVYKGWQEKERREQQEFRERQKRFENRQAANEAIKVAELRESLV